jgi:long-chain acyl-CoA synthetase
MLSHRNLVVNVLQVYCWATSGRMRDEGQESVLTVLPLYHSFAMTVAMNVGTFRGAKLILFPKRPQPDMLDLLEVVRKQQPTILPGVPALYAAIANQQRSAEFGVNSIKVCVSGAAPLPLEVMQRFERLTGAKIIEGYGLSETSPVAACNPLEGARKEGAIGIPVPDTELKIVDDAGNPVAGGEPGEVCIKGPQVMRGYWNKPEETERVLRDGWLFTGDVARMDADGYFFIVDRKKDVIITSGFNVYPREVEEILFEHPAVLEAAAVGVPDPKSGERVKAYVVLRAGMSATEADIVEHCRKKLAAYKVPKSVEFRAELPKTNVGKVLRRTLRDEARASAGAGAESATR